MMISFAITVHNEGKYIEELLDQLVPYCKETGDEIVVLDDWSDDQLTKDILHSHSDAGNIKYLLKNFTGDFSEHKNFLSENCSGDYIFQVDADEKFNENLLLYLHDIVENNENIDLFYIPRVNVVTGLTDADIARWGWQVNENGWVMFPDYQTRLFKNNVSIAWKGKVHERITGFKTMAQLPPEEEWALYHIKDIERQRKQNDFYSNL